ncbi:hypothetical protein [Streptomyces sp. NPDC091371]|uniref:hypothetical protein n=1 Tax=Streptomyces sp. NPDC091371 TaxID=3155303 RepID=UPI00341477BA
MRTRLLRSAFISLLAASAVTALVPAVASAADPSQCRTSGTGGSAERLLPGRRLDSGASLIPTPGKTELVMQPDGNLVVYALGNPGGPKLPLWHSGTYGNPGAYALMQEDGNFVVYKKDGGPQTGGALWHTATYGAQADAYPSAVFMDNGLFEVTNSSKAWSTRTGEQHARVCASIPGRFQEMWGQGYWAQSASVWMVLQQDNNLVMYRKRDGAAIWSSGTYGNRTPLVLQMHEGGDLALLEWFEPDEVRWRTGTRGYYDAYALLQDDGNFVVYRADGGPGKGGALWASGTWYNV